MINMITSSKDHKKALITTERMKKIIKANNTCKLRSLKSPDMHMGITVK